MGQNFPNGLGTFYIGIYKLVEDPSSDPIISWSKSNNGFVMCNEEARIRSKILLRFNCGKLSEFLSELKYYVSFLYILRIEFWNHVTLSSCEL